MATLLNSKLRDKVRATHPLNYYTSFIIRCICYWFQCTRFILSETYQKKQSNTITALDRP